MTLTTLAIAILTVVVGIAINIGIVVGGVAGAQQALDFVAEKAQVKPVFTLAAAFGILAVFLADLCKDSLPGATALEKNLFKFGAAFLFLVAQWLFDLPHAGCKAGALAIWLTVPAIVLLQVLGAPAPVEGDPNRAHTIAVFRVVFVSVWLTFAALVVTSSWLYRRHLEGKDSLLQLFREWREKRRSAGS